MASLELSLFWVAFWTYLAATLLYALRLSLKKEGFSQVGVVVVAVGFSAHTVALILRIFETAHLPITSLYEYCSLFSWVILLSLLVVQLKLRLPSVGAFIAPVAFMLMVVASLLPKEPERQLLPALQSHWLTIHVTLAVLGEAVFAVAFATSLMYLLQARRGGESGVSARMPALDRLDEVSYRAITLGYPLFTIGALFAGAVWAQKAWGSPWSWDPKEVSSLIVWLVYSAYLHSRYMRNWKGRRAAWLSVIGFITVIFTMLGNLFMGGLHGY